MQAQLNRELIKIVTISNNNSRSQSDEQERNNKIELVKFLLSENHIPIKLSINDSNYNANLYFHGWLFQINISAKINGDLVKNPYIGLFHPFGSIYALKNIDPVGQNVPLNNIIRIRQHFHNALSPKTSFIHIDRNNDGKAYTVCVDDETNRGIITLLIYIANPYDGLQTMWKDRLINKSFDDHKIHSLGVDYLIDSLSNINGLKKLFTTWEIELFKQVATIDYNNTKHQGVIVFDYRKGGPDSRVYQSYYDTKLTIDSNNIPYIQEIKSKLPADIRDIITWEFEIRFIYKPVS